MPRTARYPPAARSCIHGYLLGVWHRHATALAAHGAPARTTSAAHMLTACHRCFTWQGSWLAAARRVQPDPRPIRPPTSSLHAVLPAIARWEPSPAFWLRSMVEGFCKAAQSGAMQQRTPHAGGPCSDLQHRPVACWSTRISSQALEGLGDGPGSGGRHVVGGAARRDAIPPTLAQQPRARFAQHSRAPR